MKVLIMAALLALLAPQALAAPFTGAELLNRCAAYEKSIEGGSLTTEEGLDAMWCMGYVSGLLDGFGVGDFRIGEARAVCPPDAGLSRAQALKIITKWLRENPDELSKSGRRGAVIALSKAMPCQRE